MRREVVYCRPLDLSRSAPCVVNTYLRCRAACCFTLTRVRVHSLLSLSSLAGTTALFSWFSGVRQQGPRGSRPSAEREVSHHRFQEGVLGVCVAMPRVQLGGGVDGASVSRCCCHSSRPPVPRAPRLSASAFLKREANRHRLLRRSTCCSSSTTQDLSVQF